MFSVIGKKDLEILHEDEHIVVVNKPAGILSVPGKSDYPSLNKVVFDVVGCKMDRMDMMVSKRLETNHGSIVPCSPIQIGCPQA